MFIILVYQVSYLRSSTKHKNIAEAVIKINLEGNMNVFTKFTVNLSD